jgi:hypothetical protein
MDNSNCELMQFIDGKRSVLRIEVEIVQEVSPNGNRHTKIKHKDGFMYEFWSDGKFKNKDGKSKKRSTGGKPSYMKVYVEKIRELKEAGLSADLVGKVIWLVDNIEWNTGLLYKGKGKNKKYLQFKDLMEIWDIGKTKTAETINKLKNINFLTVEEQGYKLSTDFIQKGGK